MIAALLSHMGAQVIEAEDGQAALEVVQRVAKPELIVTDLMMPRMNGVELMVALRGAIPVIVMTNHPPDHVDVAAARELTREILFKPAKIETLRAVARYVRLP